jgi:hypothetical protein
MKLLNFAAIAATLLLMVLSGGFMDNSQLKAAFAKYRPENKNIHTYKTTYVPDKNQDDY